MSLTRRLRRIARAHLGGLREDVRSRPDSKDDDWEREVDLDDVDAESASEERAHDVPPDVARAYRALEVPVGSSRRVVKKGYRRVMKKYHQDRFDEDPDRRDVAGEVSKRLNQAYQTVNDYLDEHDDGSGVAASSG